MLEFFSKRKGQKGFTLIELLVVIAIIGILATIVLVSLNTARSKARDVRRISDLRQIVLALEMSYDDNDAYPSVTDCATIPGSLVTDGFIGAVPEDPVSTNAYAYGSDGVTYVLRATIENDVPDGDVDATTFTCDCSDANKYYCVSP